MPDHIGDHAFMVGGGGQLVQVALANHAVTHTVGHAPLQQRLQPRDLCLEQIQLAQILRPPGKHPQHRIDPVQTQLVVTTGNRRLFACYRR